MTTKSALCESQGRSPGASNLVDPLSPRSATHENKSRHRNLEKDKHKQFKRPAIATAISETYTPDYAMTQESRDTFLGLDDLSNHSLL